ncbi:MAG: cellobiose phosphorylase [Bacillus sp. (in: Bacteria)]|nr:cellobiose phosphorylase [Bacillus sp. (in: firmicutes)]MCM1427218.1 hypothetical protein [Eubacterium sp.]
MKTQSPPFTITNYATKSPFASFLPGIAGIYGIPGWCYYVNRGQCVSCFGVENKDHAIMEFYPAHQAYQNVKRTGFRTFLKVNGVYFEAFADEKEEHKMIIYQNRLELEEENAAHQLQTHVTYFTLPEEKAGALVRKVTVTNTADAAIELEMLDGIPACIPYGVSNEDLKTMGSLVKAWMQVEHVETKTPFYRVRASIVDTASVTEVIGGNFSFACLEDGSRLSAIVDPDVVFSYDTSLTYAVNFRDSGIEALQNMEQVTQNQFPCSFYGTKVTLKAGESFTIYEMTGQVESYEMLQKLIAQKMDGAYFEAKLTRTEEIVDDLCSRIDTHTACEAFDAYCRYTYMDNVLRGGYPIVLGENKIFYIYSRKHGDLEREYNYFSMLPEFYSQGNGSYRDVNQNRRCDTFFTPYVGTENIRTFYNLVQLDGYNPLSIEKVTYVMPKDEGESIFAKLAPEEKKRLVDALSKPFTPGAFFRLVDGMEEDAAKEYFEKVMNKSVGQMNGSFGEGYWSDHWTYNLDLIESYLHIYPEKEREILFDDSYTWFLSQAALNPRKKRYVKTANGIRQYKSLDEESRRDTAEKLVRGAYGKGDIVHSTLLEKILLLCVTKFAALDAYGMGVEMEGGKPGWYDALNGLPGLLGSSMAETYELGRMLEYAIAVLNRFPGSLTMLEETAAFMEDVAALVCAEKEMLLQEKEVVRYWNKVNDVKEAYWQKVYDGVSGNKTQKDTKRLAEILERFHEVVCAGIQKACAMEDGICPTYFSYEVSDYTEDEDGILPLHFEVKKVPLFLEGPVRFLKLDNPMEEKKRLYGQIKNSDLYDKKLSMYKVNASLKDASYEIGRAKAFTPGWLENESIWLHMEYKYLLEILKSGMYREFTDDFHKAAVPFLDPEVYGRSIYENSSFIASSKNPNAGFHGKGFVARLSGSTVEFIHMWSLMMFGLHPFTIKDGKLTLAFSPLIPAYLIGDEKRIEAAFLGKTKVVYHLAEKKDYIPEEYEVKQMQLCDKAGGKRIVEGGVLSEKDAEAVRSGAIDCIEVTIC